MMGWTYGIGTGACPFWRIDGRMRQLVALVSWLSVSGRVYVYIFMLGLPEPV